MRIAFSCPIRSKVSAEAIPIATSSAAIDAGVSQILCDNFTIGISAKKIGRTRGPADRAWFRQSSVAAGAEQLHQQHEQVDEVEIEAQRAHDRLLAAGFVIVALVIHLLDLLRVI